MIFVTFYETPHGPHEIVRVMRRGVLKAMRFRCLSCITPRPV